MNEFKKAIESYIEKLNLSKFYSADGKFSKELYKGKLVFLPELIGDVVPLTGLPLYFLIEPKTKKISRITSLAEAKDCYEILQER